MKYLHRSDLSGLLKHLKDDQMFVSHLTKLNRSGIRERRSMRQQSWANTTEQPIDCYDSLYFSTFSNTGWIDHTSMASSNWSEMIYKILKDELTYLAWFQTFSDEKQLTTLKWSVVTLGFASFFEQLEWLIIFTFSWWGKKNSLAIIENKEGKHC